MILRRLGNKKRIAHKIIAHFPPHKIYISPFFGAGGLFFQKPKSQYNIVNDLDSDVFNLFQVVMNQKEELEKAFYMMPIHSDLLEYWKHNQETEPIKKALRFLFLSNLTYMGGFSTVQGGTGNTKESFYKKIDKTFELINDIKFFNSCFNEFLLKKVAFGDSAPVKDCFIYCDPPYLDADKNLNTCYNMETWTKADSLELFETLEQTGCKWAMSEFNHPFILQQAKERNLNVIEIGERQNLKNRRTEILITNYKTNQLKLF